MSKVAKFNSPNARREEPAPAVHQAERLDLTRRMRRNRKSEWSRRLVRENRLTADDLIWPLFLMDRSESRWPVAHMPGVDRVNIDEAVREAERAARLGIPAIAPFPFVEPDLRDATASEAIRANNLMCRAVRAIKAAVPEIGIITDSALDPYTSHGHDGVLHEGEILNDASVAILVKQALALADAGADVISPSDMMDGRVGAIRQALDAAGRTTCRSCPTPRNTPRPSTARSATRSAPTPRWWATSAPTRWTPPTRPRRCTSRPRHRGRRGHGDGQAGMPYLDVVTR